MVPALTLGVGSQDQQDVLEGDRERQDPQDEGRGAKGVLGRVGKRVRPEEDLRDRVQRARADVTVDDPQGGQAERRERTAVVLGGLGRWHPRYFVHRAVYACPAACVAPDSCVEPREVTVST